VHSNLSRHDERGQDAGMKLEYRSNIDGLRAIAVLFVIAYHAFPQQVTGGFIGVDIFFVISGFLISGLIQKGLRDGSFSFLDFYARRIKRIFPALIVVLASCLVAGWILLLPDEYVSLGKHVAAGAGFISNFLLMNESGYFDTVAELKPLLHLWSLGVEEQFYIVWPALLLLSWRWKMSPLVISGIILVVSFAWNIALTKTNQTAAFYLPMTRFWELMLGCILAFASAGGINIRTRWDFGWLARAYANNRKTITEAAAWCGIALIVVAVFVIDQQRPFPGFWALLPTAGTGLLIWTGAGASLNRRLLSHRFIVYVGLISYPLYLWHWPILAFLRIVRVEEPTNLMRAAAIAAAFFLAYCTYQYVEKPIRFGAALPLKPIVASVALALAGASGLWIYGQHGFPDRFARETAVVSDGLHATVGGLKSQSIAAYRNGTCFLDGEDRSAYQGFCDGSDPTNARRIVLWGDSNAAHLFPGIDALRLGGKFDLAQFTAAGCPPVFEFANSHSTYCQENNKLVERKIRALKPQSVILAANWRLYDGSYPGWGKLDQQEVRATIARLKAMGVESIVVVGQFPEFKGAMRHIRAAIYRTFRWPFFIGQPADPPIDISRDPPGPTILKADAKIRLISAETNVVFISPLATFCNERGCLLTLPDSEHHIVAWDGLHLTKAGSIFFAKANAHALTGD